MMSTLDWIDLSFITLPPPFSVSVSISLSEFDIIHMHPLQTCLPDQGSGYHVSSESERRSILANAASPG